MFKKNIYFTLVLILFFTFFIGSSKAQNSPIEKGSKIISGHFSISSAGGELNSYNDERRTVVEFDPAVNFFVGSGFAVGAKILFGLTSRGSSSILALGVGPELSYYFNISRDQSESTGQTYGFLQSGLFYTDYNLHSDRTLTGIQIRLGAGIMHMISNSVGLFTQLAYDYESRNGYYGYPPGERSIKGNKIGLYMGLSVFLF